MTNSMDLGTDLGLLVAVAGVAVAIWAAVKRPPPVDVSPETLKQVKTAITEAELPSVSVEFFQHGNQPALELTNLGKIGATVSSIILGLREHGEVPSEIYALPEQLSFLPREKRLVYIQPHLRKYWQAHGSLVQSGDREGLRFQVEFLCEAAGRSFHTKPYRLGAAVREFRLTNFGPGI